MVNKKVLALTLALVSGASVVAMEDNPFNDFSGDYSTMSSYGDVQMAHLHQAAAIGNHRVTQLEEKVNGLEAKMDEYFNRPSLFSRFWGGVKSTARAAAVVPAAIVAVPVAAGKYVYGKVAGAKDQSVIAASAVKESASSAASTVKEGAKSRASKVSEKVKNAKESATGYVTGKVKGIKEGISNFFNRQYDNAKYYAGKGKAKLDIFGTAAKLRALKIAKGLNKYAGKGRDIVGAGARQFAENAEQVHNFLNKKVYTPFMKKHAENRDYRHDKSNYEYAVDFDIDGESIAFAPGFRSRKKMANTAIARTEESLNDKRDAFRAKYNPSVVFAEEI